MTLCIKTGMASEYKLAKAYAAPDALVLTGRQTVEDLHKSVGDSCTGIISFGLCGGLAFQAHIGQVFLASYVVTPKDTYQADTDWLKRLFDATHAYERHYWSTGDFNTANSVQERNRLFEHTKCWVIDDESYAVAQFAKERKIPFAVMRSVSDGAEDNLPPAVVNALNDNGTDNLWNVIKSVATNPFQIPALFKTAQEYFRSLDTLRTAAIQVGPHFRLV